MTTEFEAEVAYLFRCGGKVSPAPRRGSEQHSRRRSSPDTWLEHLRSGALDSFAMDLGGGDGPGALLDDFAHARGGPRGPRAPSLSQPFCFGADDYASDDEAKTAKVTPESSDRNAARPVPPGAQKMPKLEDLPAETPWTQLDHARLKQKLQQVSFGPELCQAFRGDPAEPCDAAQRTAVVQELLLMLWHSSRCHRKPCACRPDVCQQMKMLFHHSASCKAQKCEFDQKGCEAARVALKHYKYCKDKECDVCLPVRDVIRAFVDAAAPSFEAPSARAAPATDNEGPPSKKNHRRSDARNC